MVEFMTEIPAAIKDIVQDKDWNETFIFEEMPCNHKANAKPHEKIDCPKCTFDNRELWVESELTKAKKTDTTETDSGTKTIKSIKVIRGKYDDAIGIQREWQ